MKLIYSSLLCTFACVLAINVNIYAQDFTSALMPLPNKISVNNKAKSFKWHDKLMIQITDDSLAFEAGYLKDVLLNHASVKDVSIVNKMIKQQKLIKLIIDSTLKFKDSYVLKVTENVVYISAANRGALFYGIVTLDQVLMGDILNTKQKQISAIVIEDRPRVSQRILMLDPARHFIPVKDVKKYIDVMARYKFNVLQLHLSDDQGWRVEIKKHPNLTNIGAKRNAKGGMNGPDNGFYTQTELKELIAYAANRNVDIIPELDIPGHTAAIIAVYPELSCTHVKNIPVTIGKETNRMLCASNPKVYEIYEDIISEISAIFPSRKMHLGGDESVIEQNWLKCADCQKLKNQINAKSESGLMAYFFEKILSYVKQNKKEAILWCELDNIRMPANDYFFPYPKDVTLVSWRNGLTPKCMELTLKTGNQLILAPGEFTYLDYPQYANDFPEYNNWGMPITTLKKAYEFDPAYGKELQANIVGVAGTLWGEAIKDVNRALYMTYPRGFALAEAGWTEMEHRNWNSFKTRMYPNLAALMKMGVSFRVPFEAATN